MNELKYKLVKRHRGESILDEEVVDYCTREDGQLALEGIQVATHGERHNNSVHYVGRDGEVWIAELKRVYS